MGVPAFFRWLSRKYPSIIVQCVEEKPKIVDGTKIPMDTSKPNPNRVEFDNLYLDMNGIIHPCCHPENKAAPKNEDEMMIAIFEYIDRIFSIVRPRRLLYMAIDGVAPRAKMNQQRSRRFRAAKESVEKVEEIDKIREELKSRGVMLPPEKPKEEHFDSNCITPGTPFMARLAKCLHYYIHDRLNHDEGWKNISIILSDASAPGEGEHKIMDYIRRQRGNPDHDPNTHHCLCGADADLIMLGLATHEPNFTIIREEFKPNQPKPCEICGQLGHEMKECNGLSKEKVGEFDELEKPIAAETEFIFIRLNVLREYLAKELNMTNLPFEYDFERAVDDWVFMCFFVGNDFLPHLPSLEIREGAIDRLVNLYKDTVYRTGGFLTDSGDVNLSRVQLIMTNLGSVEDEIFKRRQENEEAFRKKRQRERKRKKLMSDAPAWIPQGQFAPNRINQNPSPIQNARREAYNMRREGMQRNEYHTDGRQGDKGNIDAANVLRSMMKNENQNNGLNESKGEKRPRDDDEDSDEEPVPYDAVRLWEDGWKDRYYAHKFDVSINNIKFRRDVAAEYVKGLCWVLKYYYQGCTSWNWFFPYHYAPFASDFVNVGDEKIIFEKNTKPFNPLEQLMGVFPAASKQHLPKSWGDLMIDPESPIIDFYPEDFKIDLNGKKFAWQGVALLPFVDEQRLIRTVKTVYPLLTEEEKKRNLRGDDLLYVYKSHPGFSYMVEFYEYKNNKNAFDLSPQLFHGMRGKVLISEEAVKTGDTVHSPIVGVDDIPNNYVICMRFRDPKYDDNFIFKARLLKGAKIPNPVLKPDDFHHKPGREWRPQIGMAPSHQRASLDMSGKRALNWNMQSNMSPYNAVPPGPTYFGSKRGRGSSYSGRYIPPGRKYPESYKSSERNRYSESYKSSERNQYSESYKSSERSRFSESYKSSEGNQYSESFKSSERGGRYSESFKQSQRGSYSDSYKSSESSSYTGLYNTEDKTRYPKSFDSQAWNPSPNFVPSVRSSYPDSYASQLKTQDSYSSQLKNQGNYASQLRNQDSYTSQPGNQDSYTAQPKTYQSDSVGNSGLSSVSKYSGVARTSWSIGNDQRYITSRWSPASQQQQSSVYDNRSTQQPIQQQHSSLISSSVRSQIYQNPIAPSTTIMDGRPKQLYANAQSTYYRP